MAGPEPARAVPSDLEDFWAEQREEQAREDREADAETAAEVMFGHDQDEDRGTFDRNPQTVIRPWES